MQDRTFINEVLNTSTVPVEPEVQRRAGQGKSLRHADAEAEREEVVINEDGVSIQYINQEEKTIPSGFEQTKVEEKKTEANKSRKTIGNYLIGKKTQGL